MACKFTFSSRAADQLSRIDDASAKRILRKLAWFQEQLDPLRFAIRLHPAKLGDYRFRVGDYRVIMVLDPKKKVILIAVIGHRRDVYRQ